MSCRVRYSKAYCAFDIFCMYMFVYAEHVLRINCTVRNADEQLEKDSTIKACIENLQNSHTDKTMVTDKSPRTQEITKIDESEQVETSESSVVTYLVTASER